MATENDDVDPEDKDDPEDEYTPPEREEWQSTTAALTKANAEAKKWRMRAQGKDEKWSVPGWQKARTEDDDPEDDDTAKKPPARRQPKVDVEAVKREAEEQARAAVKPGLVKAAARDAFRAAGLLVPEKGSDANAHARAMRLIDMESVDVDDDGEVTGIDEAVKAVKRDYPELFARKGARAVNAGAGSGDTGAGQKSTTSANRLAAIISGGS